MHGILKMYQTVPMIVSLFRRGTLFLTPNPSDAQLLPNSTWSIQFVGAPGARLRRERARNRFFFFLREHGTHVALLLYSRACSVVLRAFKGVLPETPINTLRTI